MAGVWSIISIIELLGDTFDPVILIRPVATVPVTIVPVAENGVEPIVAVMELVVVVDVVDEDELELLVQLAQHTPNNSAIDSNFLIKWF